MGKVMKLLAGAGVMGVSVAAPAPAVNAAPINQVTRVATMPCQILARGYGIRVVAGGHWDGVPGPMGSLYGYGKILWGEGGGCDGSEYKTWLNVTVMPSFIDVWGNVVYYDRFCVVRGPVGLGSASAWNVTTYCAPPVSHGHWANGLYGFGVRVQAPYSGGDWVGGSGWERL